MMQVTIDEVVDVIAMRHRFVAATGAVDVAYLMSGARRGASVRVFPGDRDHMLIDMISVHMLKVAIVEVIHVTFVHDCDVSTTGSMLVCVFLVNFRAHKGSLSIAGNLAAQRTRVIRLLPGSNHDSKLRRSHRLNFINLSYGRIFIASALDYLLNAFYLHYETP
jgi:hypothetical protein